MQCMAAALIIALFTQPSLLFNLLTGDVPSNVQLLFSANLLEMEEFCGSVFWDRELTWNTTNPYLTPCFEETAVVWFSPAFLILFSLFDIKTFINKKPRIPWNLLSVSKALLNIALVAVSATQLGIVHSDDHDLDPVDTVAPVVRIVSYLLALVLLVLAKMAGNRSSGVQSLFWLFAAVSEAILFRTAVDKYDESAGKYRSVYLFRLIIFPVVLVQFLLQFWPDSSPETTEREKLFGRPCPEKTSSFYSKIMYGWFDGMAWKGYRNPLTNLDLWDLNEADLSKAQVPLFFKHWNAAKANGKGKQPGILTVLFKAYGGTFFMGGVLKLVTDLLVFISPEILKLLVVYVADHSVHTWKGYLYAGVLLVTGLTQMITNSQYNRRMLLIGMRIRTSLSNAVYRKALYLSNAVKKESSVGEIVNLMSVDTQRFMDLMPFFHMLWTSPIQIGLSVYFLYNILQDAVFAGLAVMILLIPVNGVIAAKIRTLQVEQMKLKDERVKLMGEILSGVKVLKLYAWEPSFESQIGAIRAKEVKLLRKTVFLNASTIFAFTCAPVLVSLATFATFVHTDPTNVLNAEKAFVSLTLFNIMRMPLTMFPMVIAFVVQTMVSVNRLNKYLNSEEIDPTAVGHDPSEGDPVVIENASFAWNDDSVTLKDINLRVKPGSLVAIVGTVGSGKSSLLNALLGDLKKLKGRVNTTGTQAYVAQGAWIQNASLRDNILFGDPFSTAKYNKVIEACALGPDLQILAAGDQTEIGEKGINLSGGQKQRVSLARAAYKDSDVYYFDDPLSAVDAHVGKHIFETLIGPGGILAGKTRVLVTHGISFLPKTDSIVVMKDGCISEMGTYKELLFKKGEFAKFLLDHIGEASSEELDDSIIQDLEQAVGKEELRRSSSIDVNKFRRLTSKEEDISSTRRQSQKKRNEDSAAVVADKPKNQLIEAEKAETGGIDPKVYIDFIKGSGVATFTIAMSFNILFQAVASYSNIWLSEWSDESTEYEGEHGVGSQDKGRTNMYLGVYGGLGGVQALLVLIGGITLGLGTLRASATLHNEMLSRVMRAPMWFFDTTPLGRLVNRFAKDVDTADNIIPLNFRASVNMILSVLATVVVISYSTPEFLAFMLPMMVLYFFLQRFYVATSRQLKRLESVSRSPIYSHFGETISGATTIRAFALEDDFIEASQTRIDYNQKTYFPFIAANMWISVRLETMGAVIVLAATLFAIIGRESGMTPGVIGLSVSYALQITQLLGFMVRTMSELEANIVCIERMKETTLTPQEAAWTKSTKPPKDWPQSGQLDFQRYETRYREGLDLVLRGITCTVHPGEKVGIVGRTGAGKSSMTLALFRLVEPAGGSILIDGVDVTSLGLHDLRSKITIIPQDPVLFSGTLRGNLDPFDLYSDDQVWSCLELAHLKNFVKGLPEGLLHEVAEEGQNYSVGQRQLVCLARALLRKTKILVLDEATAAVDLETDDLIQKTIRSEFAESTVVTIAHRINTIMDSTRVLVLDKGEIREFDTPAQLLKNSSSIFYGMAKDAGIV